MIIKKPSFPFKLHGLEALIRRISSEYPNLHYLEEELRKTRAGINGEKKLVNIFNKYTFPTKHYIFHSLNLKSSGLFQIDTLFLSKRGAVVLEVKNIRGQISFPEDQNQMKRTLDDGQVKVFECPSIQLQRNMMLLNDWFLERNITVPIHGAVVFPNPQQHFENVRNQLKIIFPLEVPVYLRKLEANPPTLDSPTLTNIAENLRSAHREYNPFPICKTYNIEPHMIKTGVRCNQCGVHGMMAISKGWACRSCNYIDKNAHMRAILEHFMLFGDTLTNKDCRKFLQLKSPDKTSRLIKQMNIPYRGSNKGRKYEMDLNEMESRIHLLDY